jgi:hypothetical protein
MTGAHAIFTPSRVGSKMKNPMNGKRKNKSVKNLTKKVAAISSE